MVSTASKCLYVKEGSKIEVNVSNNKPLLTLIEQPDNNKTELYKVCARDYKDGVDIAITFFTVFGISLLILSFFKLVNKKGF